MVDTKELRAIANIAPQSAMGSAILDAVAELEKLRGIVCQSKDNEATAYPFWAIVRKGAFGRYVLLAGVWFSREAATAELESRRYNYGAKAFVFCYSGHDSQDLRQLYDALRQRNSTKTSTIDTALKNKRGIYGCAFCGDPTSGARSTTTGREYDCCPDCCRRADHCAPDDCDDTDRGPYVERTPFPPCPKCRSKSVDQDGISPNLECQDCGHTWQPRGVYLTKREQKKIAATAK